MELAYNVATALVATGACLAWRFVLMYRSRNWRKYAEGRLMMQLTLMIAIILSLATEVRIFGPYPGMQFVAVALYGWLVYLLVAQNRLMHKADGGDI